MMDPRPRRPPASSDSPVPGGESLPPESPPPAPKDIQRRGTSEVWLTRLLVLVLAVPLLAAVVKFILIYDPPEAFPERPPADRVRHQEALELFGNAKALIRDGKWLEAKAELQKVQALEPGAFPLEAYLARVEQEVSNQVYLTAAETALAEKKLATAKSQLDQISEDTMMFERVDSLKRQLRDTADARVREAGDLLSQGQFSAASNIVNDVLAVVPEHREARALSVKVRPPAIVDPPPPAPPTPWENVQAHFVAGDPSSAIALAQSCAPTERQCRSGLRDMQEFFKLLRKLPNLDAKEMARMLTLDEAITGGRSPSRLLRNAGIHIANRLYRTASAAKAQGQWATAASSAHRALKLNPAHEGAAQLLAHLRTKAKEEYLRAYALKDTEPKKALAIFRQVMVLTRPDDEVHQKAQFWATKLQQ